MTKTAEDKPRLKPGRQRQEMPEGPGTALARFLIKVTDDKGITNADLARELEYARPSVVSSWKAARARFPLDNLFALAEMLDVDPAYMMALYIEQYVKANDGVDRFPEIHRMLSHIATPEEWEIIQIARKARKNNSFKLRPDQKKQLAEVFEEPEDTEPGHYLPLDFVEAEVSDNRRKFARRGYARDLTIAQIEEIEAKKEAEKQAAAEKRPRKKSPAAKVAEPA